MLIYVGHLVVYWELLCAVIVGVLMLLPTLLYLLLMLIVL